MSTRIPDSLLRDSRVWRGDASRPPRQDGIASGHAALDRALNAGGWPAAGSTELLCEGDGIGELSLPLPALARLSRERRIAWLNPPFVPYAPALQSGGIDLSACLVLRVSGLGEQLWAAEQLLRSAAFVAVLTWFDQRQPADRDLRRLQLAAREGQCWHLHFRPLALQCQSSPAPLRLVLASADEALHIRILKQTGGRSGQTLTLPRDRRLLLRQRPVDEWPVYRPAARVRVPLKRTLQLVHEGEPAGVH